MKEYIVQAIAQETIESFDSRNAPELVRCKYCKYGSLYCTEDVCGETLIECNRPNLGDVIEIHEWNWFCADGKRRSNQ